MKYTHFMLCSKLRGISVPGDGTPIDPDCGFCQRYIKEGHAEAIERDRRRKEWLEMQEELRRELEGK